MHSIVPEERAAVLAEWEACAREGREFSREFRLLRPDGSIRHLSCLPVQRYTRQESRTQQAPRRAPDFRQAPLVLLC